MTVAVVVVDRAAETLGEALPRLAGALLLLVVGLVVAALVGRLVRRVLAAVGIDGLAARTGVDAVLARVGIDRPLSDLVGTAVRVALAVVVIVAAVSLLGLAALSTALNEVILFLPKLFVALVLLLAGVALATFLGARAERLGGQMDLPGPIRQLTEGAVIALFALTALAQVGVPTEILTGLVALLIVAVTLTIGLAFGLGGRDVARQLSAGRYVGGAFSVGDQIEVAGLRGRITRLESAATVLEGDDGRSVRVPNQLLVDSIVIVGEPSA